MAARVVSGERRASAESCPKEPGHPAKESLRVGRRVGTALLLVALAGLALVVPPLGAQPAMAATPALTISLTQNSPDSRIGAPITLTATVSWPSAGGALPPSGLFVEFTGTGDGGWSSGPVPIHDGTVSIERTSPVEQTETITARLANSGCTQPAADSVTHTWWRPVITIDQLDARTVIGTLFTLKATLAHGGTPISGALVRLTANDFIVGEPVIGAELAGPREETTDSNGVATFEWSGTQAAIEVVDIVEQGTGGAVAKTSHTWLAGAPSRELTVSVAPPIVRTGGGPLAATATLTEDGDPVGEATVQFWRSPTNDWVDETTDGNGKATHGYDFAGPLGIVPAYAPGAGLAGARFDSWVPTITLNSPESRSVSGATYRQTATVTRHGLPVPGIALAFRLFNPDTPEPLSVELRTTDDHGRANVDVPAPQQPGSLRIEVVEDGAPGTPVSVSTTHQWVEAPNDIFVQVGLEQSADNSRTGKAVRLTAHVTARERDLPSWDVKFAGAGLQARVAGTGTDGRARTEMSSAVPLSTAIRASVTVRGCGTFTSEPEFHEWWLPVLDLEPKNTTSPARRSVQFSATLTRIIDSEESAPVPGQPIRFTMRSQSCPLPVKVEQETTGPDGVATASLTRDGPSIDSITAEEIGVVDPALEITSHTWGAPVPPPISITLDQSTATSRAGTEVMVTAIVHDVDGPNGQATSGLPVTLLGVTPNGPNPATTNDQGQAQFTFTGTGTAPTTLTASTPFGCGVVLSPQITHEWFVPELTLTPSSGTTTTGENATVTARLTHQGNGVPNQSIELTIDNSVPGESTKTITRPTGGDGRVEFTWSRPRPGVDALTARETIAIQPQQQTGTRTWQPPPAPSTPPPSTPPPVTPSPVLTPSSVPPESPSPSPEPSATTSTPTPAPSPTDLPPTSTRVDGPEVGRPGGDIQVAGTGCRPGESLTVRLGDSELGTTRAAADGTFYLRAVVPDLPLGRYVIRSSCGTTIGDPNVDITSPQVNKALAGIAAVGATTASTFVFFLLLAKGIISFLPRRPL